MKELSLQELKEVEIETLKMFDAFCKKNNITYYLSHGTLLGAIKYKGFIPWDDDVDILIPREDYNRMVTLFRDTDRYRLFAPEKDAKYRYPFAKLCDMATSKVEMNCQNGVDLGVDIDLFPLDAWDNDLEQAKKEVAHIQGNMYYLNLTKMKCPQTDNIAKKLVMSLIMALYKMRGSRYFINEIINASLAAQKDSQYVGCKTWCIYGDREIIPAEAFSETVEVEFEGELFPAPVGWDTYLSYLYGDYRLDPPNEKRKTHHGFRAYKL